MIYNNLATDLDAGRIHSAQVTLYSVVNHRPYTFLAWRVEQPDGEVEYLVRMFAGTDAVGTRLSSIQEPMPAEDVIELLFDELHGDATLILERHGETGLADFYEDHAPPADAMNELANKADLENFTDEELQAYYADHTPEDIQERDEPTVNDIADYYEGESGCKTIIA